MSKKIMMVVFVSALVAGAGWVGYRSASGRPLLPCGKKPFIRCSIRPSEASELAKGRTRGGRMIDVRFENARLSDVLNFLATHGVDFVYSAPSSIDDLVVTVSFTRVSPTHAAAGVLRAAGVKFDVAEGGVFVLEKN